jgi:pimeloyl-ACP methyl ester carboxylesterase
VRDSNTAALTVRDYLCSTATEIDFEATGAEQREKALQATREIIIGEGVKSARFDRSILRATLAVQDAVPLEGKFPLILYSPGMGASAYQNFVAMEYLASYGFVTAAISSVGTKTREVEGTNADIETGVNDLEFAIEQMRSFPSVDADHIGVVGYSWGGMIVMFLAMRDPGIKAVASLDGSLMVKPHYEQARTLPEYDPSKIHQPVLFMIANARQWKSRTLEFYEQLQGKDVYLARFHDCLHGDFASTIIELVLHNLDDAGRDVSRIDTAYAWQCRYLRAFFEAYLKDKEEAREFLERIPEANNIPADVMSVE